MVDSRSESARAHIPANPSDGQTEITVIWTPAGFNSPQQQDYCLASITVYEVQDNCEVALRRWPGAVTPEPPFERIQLPLSVLRKLLGQPIPTDG